MSAIVTYSEAELQEFSRASGDNNPLHMSEAYAHRTPWGKRVVFGVLGALRALAALPPRPGQELASLTVDFSGPMLIGQAYEVRVSDDGANSARVRIVDGQRPLLKLTARFRGASEASASPAIPDPVSAHPPCRTKAADRGPHELGAELGVGLAVSVSYAGDAAALGALMQRLDLEARGVPIWQVAALLAQTYVVGMELPGCRALFSALRLQFLSRPHINGLSPVYDLTATVASFDARFSLLTAEVELATGGDRAAKGTVTSLVRAVIGPANVARMNEVLRASQIGTGKVAVVTGASRGLGAGFAVALASQGYTVVAGYRSAEVEMAECVELARGMSGTIVPFKGDLGDPDFVAEFAARITAAHGRLDLLVLNAGPPIPSMAVEGATAGRALDFVSRSIALASLPLHHLLGLVEASAGSVLVVSSQVAEVSVTGWAHYVAAKCAVEGLARTASAEKPRVAFRVCRPPRLLTDLTNHPVGQEGSPPADTYAAAIIRDVLASGAGGFQLIG
ncbi:MAG: SDR family NAD(P)-dependent oxidoreductase [Myxococcales bacterium]|nr:SDR family NAD(P)-dependent oxidoreductase [Myxococcales bacterium]